MDKISALIDSLLHEYDTNTSTILGRIDNKNIMIFIVIFVILMFVSKFFEIGLSIIFFIVIAAIVSYVVYSRNQIIDISTEEDLKIKLELISPRPTRLDNHPPLIDFLFSIKDFYYINPTAFYNVIQNIDNFIQLYDEIINDQLIYCVQNLQVAIEFSRTAQNNLQSIIYNLDVDKRLTKKFHQSLKEFHLIMRQYISNMIARCNSHFNPTDINNSSMWYQEYGPHAANYYSMGSNDLYSKKEKETTFSYY